MTAIQSSTNLFRRLSWSSSVPVEVRLEGETDHRCYLVAPRHSYLALLLPQIRAELITLALEEGDVPDESGWWFELVEEDSGFSPVGAVRWHWPLDLIALHAAVQRVAHGGEDPVLRLKLHLTSPPSDKLPVAAGVESTRTHFVAQVKEADFVRWGNTKRVTSLRRADLEAGWDGVAANDYDLHARLSSRVVPMPIPLSTGTPRPPSTEPGSGPKLESAYAARSLPVKVYLPDCAPPMQNVIAPLVDGHPATLIEMLRSQLPLLFPPSGEAYALAQPLVLGIVVPPESEVAWLAACMAGADGWLRIGIQLVAG